METYTVLTHRQIPLLLAKSALSCWMYLTAQITLSPTKQNLMKWHKAFKIVLNDLKVAEKKEINNPKTITPIAKLSLYYNTFSFIIHPD